MNGLPQEMDGPRHTMSGAPLVYIRAPFFLSESAEHETSRESTDAWRVAALAGAMFRGIRVGFGEMNCGRRPKLLILRVLSVAALP